MKTRILAFALVCLMVVSMLPTVVLAAETTCPEVHTLDNCTSTLVSEKVAEGCEEGYKLYQCNACGKSFMTDVVPASHEWGEQKKDVPATCHTDGKANYFVCSICGDEKFDVIKKETVPHIYSVPTGKYVNEKQIFKCKNCDATNEKVTTGADAPKCDKIDATTGEHTWVGVTPVIVTAPTATAEGLARYTCTNKDCKYTEDVKIHNHVLTEHKKVEASCVNHGKVAYFSCTICGENFLTKADAAVFKTVAEKDLVIAGAANHAWETGNVRNYVAGSCSTKTNTTYDQWCTICNDYFACSEKYTHTEGHTVDIDATCMNAGADYKVCNVCGDLYAIDDKTAMSTPAVTKDHTAYNATTYKASDLYKGLSADEKKLYELYSYLLVNNEWKITKVVNAVDNKPTCTQSCTVTVACTKCGISKDVVISATGHSYTTKTVAATCATYAFSYKVCINANCPAMTSGINAEVATALEDANTKTGIYKDTDASEAVKMELDAAAKCIAGSVTVDKKAGFAAANHVINITVVTAATCTEKGLKAEYCIHCSNYADDAVFYGPLDHNWPVDGVEADKAYIKKNVETACGTKTQHTTVDEYTCKRGCGTVDKRNVRTHTYQASYTLADAKKYHEIEGVTGTPYREADCSKGWDALTKYVCKGCGKDILVAEENSGKHAPQVSKTDATAVTYVKATCTTDGYMPAYYCAKCDQTFEKKVDKDTKLGHVYNDKSSDGKTNYVVVAAKAATCTADGTLKIVKCNQCDASWQTNGKEYTDYAKAVAAAKLAKFHDDEKNFTKVKEIKNTCTTDGNIEYWHCNLCNKNWTPVKGTTTELKDYNKNIKTYATGHSYALVSSVDAECGKSFGFAHYNCSNPNCDEQYLVNYAAPKHEKGEIIKDHKDNKAATCETTGVQMYQCTNPDCPTDYVEVLPALGHVNKDGVNLSACANNEVKDRACTRKGCDAADPTKIAKVDHVNVPTEVQPTCTADGYKATVCKNCNKIVDGTVEIIKALDHDLLSDSEWKIGEDKKPMLPTATTAGTWITKCSRCDYEKTVERTGLAFKLSADNALVTGANFTDASTIKLTVAVSGLPASTVGAIQFAIEHSANVKFKEFKVITESGFSFGSAAKSDDTHVTATLLATGSEGVAIAEEVAVMELYFVVADPSNATYTFTMDDDTVKATDMAAKENFYVAPAKDKDYAAAVSVVVKQLGNLDEDKTGTIDVIDLVMLYNLYMSADASAYNAVADLDRDGEITMLDLQLLSDYIATGITTEAGKVAYDKLVDRYVPPKEETTTPPTTTP